MTRAIFVPVLASVVANAACAQGTLASKLPTAVGCFSAHRGSWTPALALEDDSVYTKIPDTFRLLSDTLPPLAGLSGRHKVIGTASPYVLNNYWYSPSSDSVSVVWTNGSSGVALDFAVGRDTMMATARTFWDFPRPSQEATVLLLRRRCA